MFCPICKADESSLQFEGAQMRCCSCRSEINFYPLGWDTVFGGEYAKEALLRYNPDQRLKENSNA